jgi:glutamate N-acetyltransferase/amino-acid N-acetyltransferase
MPPQIIPKGYMYSTAEAGIKKPGRKDIALILSLDQAVISGVFTTNNIKAAPVRLDMKRIASGKGQAILLNSGNANACTGTRGDQDAIEMTDLVAKALNIDPAHVYICSTGVIGVPLPMQRIRPRISELVSGLGGGSVHKVAEAIMTTDTFPKTVQKKVRLGPTTGRMVGICKGAGMISPHMATMLCCIMTDIAVSRKTLDRLLSDAVNRSFHRITIDGDQSTNDTVLIMANGMCGNEQITQRSPYFAEFRKNLFQLTEALARMIVKDGEGATKTIEIEVTGAKTAADAEKAALSVANSSLVKTAFYGNDANWGRIMAALGYSGARIREGKIDITFGRVRVVAGGQSAGRDEEAQRYLKRKDILLVINLNAGKYSAKILTCDLSENYVKINAEYRT